MFNHFWRVLNLEDAADQVIVYLNIFFTNNESLE